MPTRLLAAGVLAVLTFAISSSPVGIDVNAATVQSAAAQGATPSPQISMQDMMKMHEQMMAEMKAADVKLDALVRDMNAATGDAKVTAMAAVVTELVEQHKTMHGRMGQMHQQMVSGRGRMMAR